MLVSCLAYFYSEDGGNTLIRKIYLRSITFFMVTAVRTFLNIRITACILLSHPLALLSRNAGGGDGDGDDDGDDI
jgi:hypothetical protein